MRLDRLPPTRRLQAATPAIAGFWFLVLLLTAATAPASAQYESHVVVIDSTTTQPVPTGFIPSVSGEVIVLAEGNIRSLPHSSRYDEGWVGPNGATRFSRAGQPVGNGMPYGALLGGFSTNPANYRFVGRIGAFHLLPQHQGQEFHVALNMSDADLATLDGQVTITVIFVEDGYPDFATFEIEDGTSLPIPTGLVAAFGDRFVILPYGSLQADLSLPFSGAYYGPGGLPKFNRAGQPYAEGPYGGLYAYWDGAVPGPFYLGDGGTWRAGVPAAGHELYLNLNLDPSDLTGANGSFIVQVLRVPQ